MPFIHRVGLRAAQARARANVGKQMQKRFAHDAHDKLAMRQEALPFDYNKSKGSFLWKYVTFMTTAFSIPFVASWYQIRKSGASA